VGKIATMKEMQRQIEENLNEWGDTAYPLIRMVVILRTTTYLSLIKSVNTLKQLRPIGEGTRN
jgi:hypothetical protein